MPVGGNIHNSNKDSHDREHVQNFGVAWRLHESKSGNIGKMSLFYSLLPVEKVWHAIARSLAMHIAVIDARSISFSYPNALCCSVVQVICQSYLLMKRFNAVA